MNRIIRQRFRSHSENLKSAIENRKWVGIGALVIAFALGGVEARAQQTGKMFHIGFLDGGTASGRAGHLKTFLHELSKLGWMEGKNIAFEYRFNENRGAER